MTDPAKRPWKRQNPKKTSGEPSAKMTQAEVAEARSRAALAGRRYPNLVDNMAVVRKRENAAMKQVSRALARVSP